MIKITAEIQIYGIGESAEFSATSHVSEGEANVSSGLTSTINNSTQTKNLFVLAGKSNGDIVGGSRLNDGSIYSPTSVNYYISSIPSIGEQDAYEEGGGYAIKRHFVSGGGYRNYITITIRGSGIETFTIVFDKTNNGYATKLSYDSAVSGYETKTIINNSPTVTIFDFDKTAEVHHIYIESWNKPYSSVVITSLYTTLTYTIDESRMMNCEFELREKADETLPCFGVISNSGSVEFKDYDGIFSAMIDDGALLEKKKVTFYLENTYNKTKQAISTFLTESIDYDEDNATCNISCVDSLVEWQEIKEVKIDIASGEKTMLYVYNTLVEITNSLTNNKFVFANLSDDIYEYLENITVPFFAFKSDTLWSQWKKFCVATGLYLYIDKENKLSLSKEFSFSIEV